MARLYTIPTAIAIERAPITNGIKGAAEPMELGAHVNLSSLRATYLHVEGDNQPPAVCCETVDSCWRFIMPSDTAANLELRRLNRAAMVS